VSLGSAVALLLAAVQAPIISVTVYGDRAVVVRSVSSSLSGVQTLESPVEDAQPPELRKLQISAIEQPESKKILVNRAENVRHASDTLAVAMSTSGDLTVRPEGLSVQPAVPERTDVKGDGTASRVRIAEISNDAPFPLLAGPVDVFGKTGFVGRLTLDRVASGCEVPPHLWRRRQCARHPRGSGGSEAR
jgi:hypothetical protein